MKTVEENLAKVKEAIENSPQAKVAKQVGIFARLAYQFTSAATWIWQKVIWRAYKVVRWPVVRLFRFYLWAVWNRFAKDPDTGLFSQWRGGATLAVTLLFLWFAVAPILEFFFDVGMYVATYRYRETIYLTNSQEIDPVNNVHSAQGCTHLPCSDANSVYFRIRGNLFNEAWSLWNGYGFFYPDYVAAAIPSAVSKCEVTSYGVRFKLFMRSTEIYPDLLESVCTPLSKTD